MHKTVLALILITISTFSSVQVTFISGAVREGEFIDSTGDKISVLVNENTVSLDKSRIAFLIFNESDTVSYAPVVEKSIDSSKLYLPKITLNSTTRTFHNYVNGAPGTVTQKTKYFSVFGGVQDVKIGSGVELMKYLEPVPEAVPPMKQYRAARATGWSMFGAGLAIALIGLPTVSNGDDLNLTVPIIGVVIAAAANIPFFIADPLPNKAVDIYNSKR